MKFKNIVLLVTALYSLNANAYTVAADTLKIGKPGSASDKILQMGTTAQGVVKYNATTSRLQFANDGTTYKNLGAQSGGSGGIELLSDNGDFEAGVTSNWTGSSPSTITARTGANAMFDNTSARFIATAGSQTYDSTAYATPVGLAGGSCLGSIHYITAETTNLYTIRVIDGSANVLGTTTMPATAGSVSQFAYVPFLCPAAGVTVKLEVVSSGSAVFIDLDNAHLGSDSRLAEISQANIVGSAYIATTASCQWTRTSATLGSFTTQAACPGPTVSINNGPGVIQTTDTDLPKFTVNNLPPGEYEVVITPADVSNGTAIGVATLAINDGTTTSNPVSAYTGVSGGTGESQAFSVVGHFAYTSTANRTFELYGATPSNALTITNTTSLRQMNFMIKRFPTATETAIRVDTLGWHVDANISGTNPSLGGSSISTYTDIESATLTLVNNAGSGILTAQVPCSGTNPPTGTTCAAGSESLGVSFTVPNAGDVLACASFAVEVTTGAAGSIDGAFELVETPNAAQTISQEGKSRVNFQNRVASSTVNQPISRLCGVMNFASAGQKTIRLMYEQAASGTISSNILLTDADTARGQRDVHFEVYPLNYLSGASPVFKGMMSSNGSGQYRNEYVIIADGANCTTTPCTVSYQSGAWVSGTGVTRTSQGLYILNFLIPFSAPPSCTGVSRQVGTGATTVSPTAAASASSFSFDTRDPANAVQDSGNIQIHCIGPK